MNLRDEKAWLEKYGHSVYHGQDVKTHVYKASWKPHNSPVIFIGYGSSRKSTYHNLFIEIKTSLFDACR